MKKFKKKGGLMKILIPALAYLAGVLTGDMVQPMLAKVPGLGKLVTKLDKDNSINNSKTEDQ